MSTKSVFLGTGFTASPGNNGPVNFSTGIKTDSITPSANSLNTGIHYYGQLNAHRGISIISPTSGTGVGTLDSYGGMTMPTVYTTNNGASGTALSCKNDGTIGIVSSLKSHKMNITYDFNTSFIYQLKPAKFQYRKVVTGENGTKTYSDEPMDDYFSYGLIADDTESIESNLCSYDKDNKLSGIIYNNLFGALIKCIQEQKTLITTLQNNIATLTADVTVLKNNVTGS